MLINRLGSELKLSLAKEAGDSDRKSGSSHEGDTSLGGMREVLHYYIRIQGGPSPRGYRV